MLLPIAAKDVLGPFGGAQAVSGGWLPSDLGSALWAWYDSSNAASVRTGASGMSQASVTDPVSEWRDISGNARHVAQATSANQPVLAADGITFDPTGGNKRLDGGEALSQPFTYVIYASSTVPGSGTKALLDSATGAAALFGDADVVGGAEIRSYAGGLFAPGPDWDSNPHVYIAGFSGASSYIQRDDEAPFTGDPSTGGFSALRIGDNAAGSAGMTGSVQEVFVVNRLLTTEEIASVVEYLTGKWG